MSFGHLELQNLFTGGPFGPNGGPFGPSSTWDFLWQTHQWTDGRTDTWKPSIFILIQQRIISKRHLIWLHQNVIEWVIVIGTVRSFIGKVIFPSDKVPRPLHLSAPPTSGRKWQSDSHTATVCVCVCVCVHVHCSSPMTECSAHAHYICTWSQMFKGGPLITFANWILSNSSAVFWSRDAI